MPDLAFFPAAGGDGLVAMWRAVGDLRRIGLPNLDVRICPAQAAGAAPMVAALNQGLDYVPFFPDAYSRALSIGDPTGGWIALRAVRESNGFGVAVTDHDILATGRLLARNGLLVEPSSAASVAGALQALREQPDLRDQTIVCVITSSGLKWLDDYMDDEAPLPGGVEVQTVDEARTAVDKHIAV
jgi:threonine synthase